MKNELILWLLLVLVPSAHAAINTVQPNVPKFLEVTPNIFRSGRPDPQGVKDLIEQGLKTDLDLENATSAVEAEQKNIGNQIKFISEPMSVLAKPSDAEVDQDLAILNDPSNFPVLVHCEQGEDRSGLIVALYRVETQKWTPEAAYQEWVANGFHQYLVNLSNYFKKRTEM
jgi:protein tyrosine/serine phosphatase